MQKLSTLLTIFALVRKILPWSFEVLGMQPVLRMYFSKDALGILTSKFLI